MPIFTYTAIEKGRRITGEMEASNAEAVLMELSRTGRTPLEVEAGDKDTSAAPVSRKRPPLFSRRIGAKQITVFTRQFATLLGSGLPLARALNFLQDQNEGSAMSGVIANISEKVRAGQPLSTALSEHPALFDRLYISLVAAGESGGMLAEAMDRLALMRESSEDLQSRIKGAMIYPAIMSIAMVGAVIVMMVVVVPRFAEMFSSMGQTLPTATQILLNVSNTLQSMWWVIPLILVILVPAYKKYVGTAEGRFRVDSLKIRIPTVGGVVIQISTTMWCRTLGTLIGAGVPLLSALQSSVGVTGNMALSRVVEQAISDVREGAKLAPSLKKGEVLPNYVIEMISMGEESGSLDDMLNKVAEQYERDVNQLVKNLTGMLEPILILVMGGVVGFIIMAMLLPIFQMQLMAG